MAALVAVSGVAALAAAEATPYSDVPSDADYAGAVSTLSADGVFEGTECDEGFCPNETIDRATMAVWTVRVLDGADPAPVSFTRFADVEATHPHGGFIERLAELEVTDGCGDGTNFCPDRAVTRAQMAAFLSRAFNLAEGPDPGFSDVPADAWYATYVAKLAASGITSGCGDGTNFCPDDDTTRAQMAAFLSRALELDGQSTGSDSGASTKGSSSQQKSTPPVTTQPETTPTTQPETTSTTQPETTPATIQEITQPETTSTTQILQTKTQQTKTQQTKTQQTKTQQTNTTTTQATINECQTSGIFTICQSGPDWSTNG